MGSAIVAVAGTLLGVAIGFLLQYWAERRKAKQTSIYTVIDSLGQLAYSPIWRDLSSISAYTIDHIQSKAQTATTEVLRTVYWTKRFPYAEEIMRVVLRTDVYKPTDKQREDLLKVFKAFINKYGNKKANEAYDKISNEMKVEILGDGSP